MAAASTVSGSAAVWGVAGDGQLISCSGRRVFTMRSIETPVSACR